MVLNKLSTLISAFIKHITIILLLGLSSACSLLDSRPDSNNNAVVPVEAMPATDTQPSKSDQSTPLSPMSQQAPTSQRAPTDVLASILDSAKKAINQQQWLRAQRHLEHALRVAPKNAEIFYIYADVYQGLGVNEQVINMLKRAKFLAKSDSDIGQLASEKLERLAQ